MGLFCLRMSSFLHILIHSLLYIILFTGLGIFIGYKWHEKKCEKEEEEDYSDDEEYSDSEEEDENPGRIVFVCHYLQTTV